MEKDANIIHFKQENEWNMYQNNAWEIENLVLFFLQKKRHGKLQHCACNHLGYAIVQFATLA